MLTFNVIIEARHIGLVTGYSYTLEANVLYVKDREGKTTAIFNNATVEQQGKDYYNIYV